MPAVSIMPYCINQYFDDSGVILAGGSIETLVAGTVNTRKDSFTDATGLVKHENPVQLDGEGRAVIWLGSGAYKFVWRNALGSVVKTVDGVSALSTASVVNTIIDLKNLPAGNSPLIQTLGAVSINDGGGWLYYWDANSTAAYDDGMIILPSSAPVAGRYIGLRPTNGELSLKIYGAVCDGVTDDSAKMATCATYCATAGLVMLIPKSTYMGANVTIGCKVHMARGAVLTWGNFIPALDLSFDPADVANNAGLKWETAIYPQAGVSYYAMSYGGNLFTALPYGTSAKPGKQSPAAKQDWYGNTLPQYTFYSDMCYGNGVFIAAASLLNGVNRILRSPDGINWTGISATGDDWDLRAVVFGNGVFIGCGTKNNIVTFMYSTDGITWTASTSTFTSSAVPVSAAFSPMRNVFCCVGTNVSYNSFDGGVTWTKYTVASHSFLSVCYSGGVFVACGQNSLISTSRDGGSAFPSDHWIDVNVGGGSVIYHKIVAGQGIVVVFTNNGKVLISRTLSSFWSVPVPQFQSVTTAAYGNGIFIAFAYVSGSDYITLTSGIQLDQYVSRGNDLQGGVHASGVVVGTPTGGAKGFGTINAKAVYDDNTLLTGYVLDHAFNERFSPERWSISKTALDEYLKRVLTVDQFCNYIKQKRVLPAFEEIEETQKLPSVGSMVQRLWETIETMAIYIADLNERLKRHESDS